MSSLHLLSFAAISAAIFLLLQNRQSADAAPDQTSSAWALDGVLPEPLAASLPYTDEAPTFIENLTASVSAEWENLTGSAMQASEQLKVKIKSSEGLRLTPYNLGDGGWTVGYGHFEKRKQDLPILKTEADANALFEKDLYQRAEKWVKAYVNIPLKQHEFDALTHIAYNMSPKSFKKFADSVNAGQGIAAIANQSIAWVDPSLQNGIANRRGREVNMFENGVYA